MARTTMAVEASDQALEVLGEAAVAGQPGEAALDHPAPRQDLEATAVRRALDDLQPQPFAGCGRGRRRAPVAAVGEQVAKPGKAAAGCGPADQGQAVAVLDVGGMDREPRAAGPGYR